MSFWTDTIDLTLPYSPEMAAICAKIGKAMDNDIGGERSFQRTVTGYDGETPIYGDTLRCVAGCAPGFKANVEYFKSSPDALFAACAADYALRWPDLVPPTLAECEQFCAEVTF